MENPFRKERSVVVENWGKTKFKPTNFGSSGNKPFKKHFNGSADIRNFNNGRGKKFDKNKKESYKFNEVARNAKPEEATPWKKYKNELVFKQREEEQSGLQANMESDEAKNALKQREISYRKSMIEQKKQEPIVWENFDEGETVIEQNEKSSKNANNQFPPKSVSKKPKKMNVKKYLNKHLDTKSKSHVQSHTSKFAVQRVNEELISKEILDNFDSKKLNYEQNDKLRRAITTAAFMVSGSLESAVADMKRKKLKKIKNLK